VGLPAVVAEGGSSAFHGAGFGIGSQAVQRGMDATSIVVVTEVHQLTLEILRIPKGGLIQELVSERATSVSTNR